MRNERCRPWPASLRLPALAVSAMLLASCGPNLHQRLADLAAPLRVDVPTTCEELLEQIPLPLFGPDDDARPAYVAMEAVAIEQSGVIELARECLRRQRLDYA